MTVTVFKRLRNGSQRKGKVLTLRRQIGDEGNDISNTRDRCGDFKRFELVQRIYKACLKTDPNSPALCATGLRVSAE